MENRLLFRRAILSQLEAASPASVPFETLAQGLKLCGLRFSERELRAAAEYLREKNYLSLSVSKISSSHTRAKLTADGLDYLESGEF